VAERLFPNNVKPCADCGQLFPLPAGMSRRRWLFQAACLSCEPRRLQERIRAGCVVDSNGCWIWQGSLRTAGYGQINVHDRPEGAHVVSFEAFKGPVPEGKEVCHTCDVRPCCNPEHLFAGTHKENVADMWAKGRGVKPPRVTGKRHHKATLTDSEVAELCKLRASGLSQREVAKRFGVSQSTVWRLFHGETRQSA
jgi:predicted DNA-binding protein (UPF0251 family)